MVEVLVRKVEGSKKTGIRTVVLSGRVAANSGPREMNDMASRSEVKVFFAFH